MASLVPIPQISRSRAEPLLATVGNTPLLRPEKIPPEFPGVEILAKAEYFNPGGSVKDRAAPPTPPSSDSADKYLSERFWEEA